MALFVVLVLAAYWLWFQIADRQLENTRKSTHDHTRVVFVVVAMAPSGTRTDTCGRSIVRMPSA